MALLPPFFLDTVVAVGIGDDPQQRKWIGTGFLYGHRRNTKPDDKNYGIWFITNKHVINNRPQVYLKFNSAIEQDSSDEPLLLIDKNNTRLWYEHPSGKADIAIVSLNAQYLRQRQRQFSYFQSDEHIMSKDEMKNLRVTEGDRVFVLGFPMGLVAPERQYVICRSGIFGRIRDYLDDRTEDYLIDALVFPGNSGGPVIICPSALAIEGTTPPSQALLVGVVKSYVSYRETAISEQTGLPRIIFEENSGLAAVEGPQTIAEAISFGEQELAKGRSADQASPGN